MALLTNPFFQIGAGLLASSGPSLQPINPYRGINDGLMAIGAARQDEQRAQYMQMQQQQMQREMEAQAKRDAYIASLGDPMASAFPNEYAQAAASARFSPKDQTAVIIKTAGELGLSGYAPETPVEVKTVNGQVVDYTAMTPPAIADPRGVTGGLYDAAKKEGYPGSLTDFMNMRDQNKAVKIDMGGTDRVSPQDAKLMRYPDGSSVLPGTLWEDARARGVTVATRADEKVEEIDAKESVAQERAAAPLSDYAASVDLWRADPQNVEKWATIEQERRRLAQMLASVRNPGRAPTDADVNLALQDVPSPVSALGGVAAVTGGGDPFTARLRVLAKELGGTLPGQPPKVTTKEQYDALPSGAEYTEDDGQLYRKP